MGLFPPEGTALHGPVGLAGQCMVFLFPPRCFPPSQTDPEDLMTTILRER